MWRLIFALSVFCFSTSFATELSSIASFGDWKLYQNDRIESECYIAIEPHRTRGFRGGETVNVNRGDDYFGISYIRGKVAPNYVAGFPLDITKPITVEIGNLRTRFFSTQATDTDEAWNSPKNDLEVIDALKNSDTLTVTSTSTRGTIVVDNYTAEGFKVIYDEAEKNCR